MVQRVYQLLFKDIQDLFSFEKVTLGSHSVRKYTSIHVRGCGIIKDKKNIVGNGRVEEEFQIVDFLRTYEHNRVE